ncbi:mechanosensitive ion channel family protein [Alteromonadaceae bacterium M269]|jgi:small-conductance mechanosensitive channel|nr:mechanosensitive ion channel family protein [Alteromonadaceae bacterium M269]
MIMENLIQTVLSYKAISTLILVAALLASKYILVKWVRKRAKAKDEDRRDLVNNIKNFLNFLLVVLLFAMWAGELQNFALSIAAFSVALVLATRELIQCIIGFFYLMSTRPFRIGDWIQVGEVVGEVSETDWIKTTLLEIDMHNYQYSGKTAFIPNNKLITSSITNLNFLKRYINHRFTLVRDQSVNPFLFIDELLEKAQVHCGDFQDVASRYNHLIERRLDVNIAGPEPHMSIGTSELGDTKIDVIIFCPTERANEIEQLITKDFMALWFKENASKA